MGQVARGDRCPAAFQIVRVPAGNYEVQAAAQGFKTAVRRGTGVTVGASVPVNFELAVGEMQQRVEAQAAAPQLETTSAAVRGVVGETAVRELPLNGRDWLQLVTLQRVRDLKVVIRPLSFFGPLIRAYIIR